MLTWTIIILLAIAFVALVAVNGDEEDDFVPFSKEDQDFEK